MAHSRGWLARRCCWLPRLKARGRTPEAAVRLRRGIDSRWRRSRKGRSSARLLRAPALNQGRPATGHDAGPPGSGSRSPRRPGSRARPIAWPAGRRRMRKPKPEEQPLRSQRVGHVIVHGYSPFCRRRSFVSRETPGNPVRARADPWNGCAYGDRGTRVPSDLPCSFRGPGETRGWLIRSGQDRHRRKDEKKVRSPRGDQDSADSPMPAVEEQTSGQTADDVERPAFFPVSQFRSEQWYRSCGGECRPSARGGGRFYKPLGLKVFLSDALQRFGPALRFLTRRGLSPIRRLGRHGLVDHGVRADSRRRRPAAQSQAASSAISAKLNCGSGNGKRPRASAAVGTR